MDDHNRVGNIPLVYLSNRQLSGEVSASPQPVQLEIYLIIIFNFV